ncbi:MAG TPA: S41 family peptidase [Bacteroidales bacterium]|nr:S41 family peptidase [Bacteroidales bacterium]HSA44766.1 S41 family peptidase [Bacteroidales bacterium]
MSNKNITYLPLLFAFLILLGIYIGTQINRNTGNGILRDQSGSGKVDNLIRYIEENYVDTVGRQALYDGAIEGLLNKLDPHSQYIPASDFQAMMDPLRGNFEGIGVQFRVFRDSITVVHTLEGGPSEAAGIKAGDRIISADGKKLSGRGITSDEVVDLLKGPSGSKVVLKVYRRGLSRLLTFTVSRGVIETSSLDAAFMIGDDAAYIKISRFSATTAADARKALIRLHGQGMKKLIVDLRDNSGGFLQAAIDLAGEFLPKKRTIVYTEGRKRSRKTYYAEGNGTFTSGELIILINEGSASASEILAGAVQDNDRGLIIGRRSFGKGLVQEELDFRDGSAVRLTVAKYYTPSGRCIQRAYDGEAEDYAMEPMRRLLRDGDLQTDTIAQSDTVKYYTSGGRVVYGGGGISPDFPVPPARDESFRLLHRLSNSGLLQQHTFEYLDIHRKSLETYRSWKDFARDFSVPDEMLTHLLDQAKKQGIQDIIPLKPEGRETLRTLIKAFLARNLFSDEGFYFIYNQTDQTVIEALKQLQDKFMV